MAALKNKKNTSGGFSNQIEVIKVVYDFAKDGGSTGALDILTADANLVVLGFHVKVLTTCVGAGMTLDVGISGGDTDILLDGAAVASLVANAMIPATLSVLSEGTPNTQVFAMPLKLASGEKLIQTIGVAALTAGKYEYVFQVMKL